MRKIFFCISYPNGLLSAYRKQLILVHFTCNLKSFYTCFQELFGWIFKILYIDILITQEQRQLYFFLLNLFILFPFLGSYCTIRQCQLGMVREDTLVLFPILGIKSQFLPVKYDVRCCTFVDVLYQVEEVSSYFYFAKSYYVLFGFLKCFFLPNL